MKIISFIFLSLVLPSSRLIAQATANKVSDSLTVEEIIQKHSDAMGGLETFNKVKTTVISGKIFMYDSTYPITIRTINGRAMRVDLVIGDRTVTSAYKDGKGWKLDPFAGDTAPTEITGAELIELRSESFLANRLMDYKKRGYTVELRGMEEVEGAPTYKIRTAINNTREMYYYIDTSSFLVRKTQVTKDATGRDTGLETYFYNFKDFGNLKFPMLWKQNVNGNAFQEVHFDKLQLDARMDEKIFDKPVQ